MQFVLYYEVAKWQAGGGKSIHFATVYTFYIYIYHINQMLLTRRHRKFINENGKPVQVSVGWSLNVEVSSADVVDSFIINHEGTI